jgi:hypothetical protein
MIHRAALFTAALAAALMLAVGLVAAGFAPGAGAAPAAVPVAATAEAPAAPTVQVDTVYVAPPAAPQDITINRTVAATSHGDDDGEGGGDD